MKQVTVHVHLRKKADGNVILVGEGWNANVMCWHSEQVMLPRKDKEEGDKDDFIALKHYIDKVV